MTAVAGDVAGCDTPLRAVFQINLNGKTVSITADAARALEQAAGNAILSVQATDALRTLFVRAKLL